MEEIILIEGSRPLPEENNKPRSVTTQLKHMLIPPRIEPPSWLKPYDEARIVDPQDVNPIGIMYLKILSDIQKKKKKPLRIRIYTGLSQSSFILLDSAEMRSKNVFRTDCKALDVSGILQVNCWYIIHWIIVCHVTESHDH